MTHHDLTLSTDPTLCVCLCSYKVRFFNIFLISDSLEHDTDPTLCVCLCSYKVMRTNSQRSANLIRAFDGAPKGWAAWSLEFIGVAKVQQTVDFYLNSDTQHQKIWCKKEILRLAKPSHKSIIKEPVSSSTTETSTPSEVSKEEIKAPTSTLSLDAIFAARFSAESKDEDVELRLNELDPIAIRDELLPPAHLAFKKMKATAASNLIASVRGEAYNALNVSGCSSEPAQMWANLIRFYIGTKRGLNARILTARLTNHKIPSLAGTVSGIELFENLVREMETDYGIALPDPLKAMILLNSLPGNQDEPYEEFIKSLHRGEDENVEFDAKVSFNYLSTRKKIVQECERLKNQDSQRGGDHLTSHMSGGPRVQTQEKKCHRCKQTGHRLYECNNGCKSCGRKYPEAHSPTCTNKPKYNSNSGGRAPNSSQRRGRRRGGRGRTESSGGVSHQGNHNPSEGYQTWLSDAKFLPLSDDEVKDENPNPLKDSRFSSHNSKISAALNSPLWEEEVGQEVAVTTQSDLKNRNVSGLDSMSNLSMTPFKDELFDVVKTKVSVYTSGEKNVILDWKGKVDLMVGNDVVTIRDVVFNPHINTRIISLDQVDAAGIKCLTSGGKICLLTPGSILQVRNKDILSVGKKKNGLYYLSHPKREARHQALPSFHDKESHLGISNLFGDQPPVQKLTMEQAHAAFGHKSLSYLRSLLQKEMFKLVGSVPDRLGCLDCRLTKRRVVGHSHKRTMTPRGAKAGQHLSGDTVGIRIKELGGSSANGLVSDHVSGFVKRLKGATKGDIPTKFDATFNFFETQSGNRALDFRSDQEYTSNDTKKLLRDKGILPLLTTTNDPGADALAESHQKMIMESAAASLLHSGMGPQWEGYAVDDAILKHNNLPFQARRGGVPWALLRDSEGALYRSRNLASLMAPFGTMLTYHPGKKPTGLPKLGVTRAGQSGRGRTGVFVGICPARRRALVWDVESNKIGAQRNVVYENRTYGQWLKETYPNEESSFPAEIADRVQHYFDYQENPAPIVDVSNDDLGHNEPEQPQDVRCVQTQTSSPPGQGEGGTESENSTTSPSVASPDAHSLSPNQQENKHVCPHVEPPTISSTRYPRRERVLDPKALDNIASLFTAAKETPGNSDLHLDLVDEDVFQAFCHLTAVLKRDREQSAQTSARQRPARFNRNNKENKPPISWADVVHKAQA
jgi:hypothetical protein